jgi:hypothetical protein
VPRPASGAWLGLRLGLRLRLRLALRLRLLALTLSLTLTCQRRVAWRARTEARRVDAAMRVLARARRARHHAARRHSAPCWRSSARAVPSTVIATRQASRWTRHSRCEAACRRQRRMARCSVGECIGRSIAPPASAGPAPRRAQGPAARERRCCVHKRTLQS